jgi:hypothetical protein
MRKILVLGLVLIAVAALTVGVAFAQSPAPEGYGGYGHGMMGGRGGQSMMGFGAPVAGSYGPMHEYMVATFAETFALTPEALQARLDAGETMWQVAESQGYDLEAFRSLMLEARSEALQQAVEDGTITQDQAQWMSQRMNRMGGFGNGACDGSGPEGKVRPQNGMRGFGMRGARASQGG